MNQEELMQTLEKNGKSILSLFDGLSLDKVRWKPAPGKWSLLEILNHLCDEEREDFRKRLSLVLENPEQDWPPINPEGWVQEREYNARDLEESLTDFKKERAKSLKWLRSLKSSNWNQERRHPRFGSIKAGDLLASWVAHDLFHIRQIVNTNLAFLSETVKPFSIQYSGA